MNEEVEEFDEVEEASEKTEPASEPLLADESDSWDSC